MSKIIAGASALTLAVGLVAATSAQAATVAAPGRVDLKVLVLATTGGTETESLVTEMDREGIPYTVLSGPTAWETVSSNATYLSQTINAGTPKAMLEGHYEGIIVPTRVGMTSTVANALDAYEGTFGVREVGAYAYPNPGTVYPLAQVSSGALDGQATTLTSTATAGSFAYLKSSPLLDTGVYGYPTSGLSGELAGTTWTPLVTVPSGTIMGVLADSVGREKLVTTADSNGNMTWIQILGRGVLSWLTRGVSLSYARDYFSVQADDLFLADDRWNSAQQCTYTGAMGSTCLMPAGFNASNVEIQMTPGDVSTLAAWEATHIKIGFAFNASGASTSASLVSAIKSNLSSFYFINHTWDHEFLGCIQNAPSETVAWLCVHSGAATVPPTTVPDNPVDTTPADYSWYPAGAGVVLPGIIPEITLNRNWGIANLGTSFNPSELVTGEHSGLTMTPQQGVDNPNLVASLTPSLGITSIASDASRETSQRSVGSALTVPRHPMNIFYNTATYQEATSEYSKLYPALVASPTLYADDTIAKTTFDSVIVPSVAGQALTSVYTNDPRPFYAHQSNLTGDNVLLPVLESILSQHDAEFVSPTVQTTLSQQAKVLQTQATWAADRTALAATPYLDADGVHIPTAGPHGTMPLTVPTGTTGLAVDGFQAYDGSPASYAGSLSGWTNATSASAAVTSPISVGYKLTPGAPSAAPTGIAGDHSVKLTWPVPNIGGSAITAYHVTPYLSGIAQPEVVIPVASVTIVGTTASATITSPAVTLANNTAYTFTVAAENIIGTGPQSTYSLPIKPRTVPTAVTGDPGDTQVVVSWVQPVGDGGPAVTGYKVQVAPVLTGIYADAAGSSCLAAQSSTAVTCTATGLTNGADYTFQVSAIDSNGTTLPSAASALVRPYGVPGAPAKPGAVPFSKSVALTWSAPVDNGGRPVDSYHVQVATSPVGTYADATGCTVTATLTGFTCTVTGLTNGVYYTFVVAAHNPRGQGGYSVPSDPVSPLAVPAAPSVVMTAADGQANVSWTPSLDTGGRAITGYQVLEATNALGPFTTAVGCESASSNTGLTCTATGLTNGTSYWFTVGTSNSVGTGAPSDAVAVIPFGTAAAPTGLVATRGNTTANLGWTAPADNGNGRAITGYVVTVTPAGGTAYAVAEPNSTNVTINGLTNGTSYTFTVHAVTTDVATGDHAGFESVASNAVTPSGVPIVAIKALPATIAPVTTAAKVTYSWTGTPKGSPIAKYDLYVRRAAFGKVLPGAWSLLKAGLRTTAYAVAINPGETLVISVRATDAASTLSGFAPASQVVTSVLPTSKLTRSKSGWAKVGASTTYQSKTLGAAAQTASVSGIRRIFIVAATGVGYGSVTVWIGKTKIKALSLATTKAKAKASSVFVVVLTAKQTSTLRGAVIVTVATKGKLVRLGGLGVLR